MSEELRYCPNPWCNESRSIGSHYTSLANKYYVLCNNCRNATKMCLSEAEAIAAWNTRPIEDELRARVAKLETSIRASKIVEQNERIAALEQWQREAVPFLKKKKEYAEIRFCNGFITGIHQIGVMEDIHKIDILIKQAEGE